MCKKKKNLDIEALTEEQKTRKIVIKTNTEHFWSSGMSCRDDDDQVIEIVDPSTTTFEAEGKDHFCFCFRTQVKDTGA